jgi:hypothetical protein
MGAFPGKTKTLPFHFAFSFVLAPVIIKALWLPWQTVFSFLLQQIVP